jgi:ankyrin repeat protein
MHSAVYGSVADMAFLLAHGANANAANKAGHTPLMRAMPDLQKMRLLVAHDAKVNAVTADGATALMIAANIRGAAEAVGYLLRKGADFSRLNKAGL